MKGEFGKWVFRKKPFGAVLLQEGRVQLDADWNENLDLQLRGSGMYLEVWERRVDSKEDSGLSSQASGEVDVGTRKGRVSVAEEPFMRLTRKLSGVGTAGSVELTIGTVAKRKPRRSFVLPAMEVEVGGVLWRRVASLSPAGPADRVFVVKEGQGGEPALLEFGNDKNGARPPAGSRVTVRYRFGAGKDGNKSG